MITAIMMISIMPVFGSFAVAADEYYPMACAYGEFEVSYIEDDGTFSKISCHSNFKDAKKAMKANEDYVVRYAKSYSPSKIVAMNSGLAYTYPGRRNSSIMYLYQNPNEKENSKYKTTYVANHYEMTYVETCGPEVYDISTGGKGYVRVVLNGFEGFTDLEYTDLVPFKFINKGIPIYLGGRNTYESEDPFSVKLQQNYFELKVNGSYTDLIYHYYRAYPKSSSDRNCLSYAINVDNGVNYLNAGMKIGIKYYSDDGINFYSDQKLKNKVATVYNYYQFLPLRSKTMISAGTLDSYLKSMGYSSSVMKNEGSSFINAEKNYGCNALIVYAMACLESAYGTSWYALNRNNLFGWSAYDDSPGNASSFSSVSSCVNEQMGRNLNWFLDYTNSRYFGSGVGNKGAGVNVKYASDPYWGMKIAAIAYSIDKYANGKNGNLSDHNHYALGFVKNNYNDVLYDSNISWDPNFYKTKDGNSVLYTGRYGSHYQKDLIVVLLEDLDSRYRVQSTNPITGGNLNTNDGVIAYSWNDSVAYIETKDVVILNNASVFHQEVEPDHEPISLVSDMSLNEGVLTMEGIGLITGYNLSDSSKVVHKVNIYDLKNNEKIRVIDCENKDSNGYSINDGYDYQWSGFSCSIPLNELNRGSYIFRIETSYDGKSTFETLLKSYNDSLSFLSYEDEENSYTVRLNDFYGFRIEADINDKALNYTDIAKPSERSSLVTLDSVTYEETDGTVYAVFEGLGMIYYLNYDLNINMHELYLVNENEVIRADTSSHACSFDYRSFYQSSFSMDNICYTAKADLKDLNGEYRLILKVNNGEYHDLAEITNAYGFEHSTYSSDLLKTSFFTDSIRYRLLLHVDHYE